MKFAGVILILSCLSGLAQLAPHRNPAFIANANTAAAGGGGGSCSGTPDDNTTSRDTYWSAFSTDATYYIGQLWNNDLGATNLCGVDFAVYNNVAGNNTTNLWAQCWTVDASTNLVTLLGTSDVVTGWSGAWQTKKFTFASAVALSANTHYAITLSLTNGAANAATALFVGYSSTPGSARPCSRQMFWNRSKANEAGGVLAAYDLTGGFYFVK